MKKMSILVVLSAMWMAGQAAGATQAQVWDHAETNFSGRFDENAGDLGTSTPANGLLLWNRLGSEDQIANSEVGPNGTYTAGTFVPGPFGDALELNMRQQFGCTFPISLLDTAEGCLEFWAKLSDFPVQMPWDGCNPGLIGYPRPVGDDGYLFYFNANNGVADGGLCAGTHLGHIGTGSFGNWTYSQAIGGGDVAEWHHYALVWNAKGLPGIGNGTRKVAIFVDGVQIASHGAYYDEVRLIGEPDVHVFGLLNHHGITGGRVAFDNLKIWNYAKTDFSDRFDEDENDPGTPSPANGLLLWNRLGSEDQIANSEVGPNGTYTTGTFVPGPFGNALELNMQQRFGCTFPISLLDTAEGCLEFWAKLSDFPVQMPWDGCNPGLVGYPKPVGSDGCVFYFSANNGVADGGLCAGTHLGHVGTGSFGNWTYSQAIGGGDVAEWHHYALVWNAKGLPGIGDGTRKLAIFVDGVQTANHGVFHDRAQLIGEPDVHVFGLLNHQGLSQGRVAFDNLKIWNYAKTDFSDRFDEDAGDPGTPTPTDGLLLWNRLGSEDQIANSEVGPSGTYTAGTFVPGVSGNALELNMQQQFGCTFPISLLRQEKGCIEFWAKLSDFPAQMPFSKCVPSLMGCGTLSNPEYYLFFFSANDGNGNGGLCVRCGYGYAGTGLYGSWTYSQAIGGGNVVEWHHYALVWNANGLPEIGDGTRKVGIFLDGQLISASGFFHDNHPLCLADLPDPYVFGLLNHQGLPQGRVAFDNLKIWNYAKTDFSDRFDDEEDDPGTPTPTDGLLLWNRLGSEDQIANSEVGPSGTYTAGTFVPGPFGDALELSALTTQGVTFPISVIPRSAGCIEFWARVSDVSGALSAGHKVSLYTWANAQGSVYPMMAFNGNDGTGNGGLCGGVWGLGSTGTGMYDWSWTYASALQGASLDDWHHYALTWSVEGVAGLTSPVRRVAIYVDGTLNSGNWGVINDPPSPAEVPEGGRIGLLYLSGLASARAAVDNVKIWNYAKTDFSDRFDEDAGDPGTPAPANELLLWNRLGSADQIANSEVGPNGTYTAGTFVPGPFGDALELNMQQQLGCTFPISPLDTAQGCLEFWAKLSDFPVQMPWDGCNPGLIGYPRPVGDDGYLFYFNANNGVADGGLCAGTHLGHIGTGSFGNWTYSQAIGGGNVAEWHHYALVWNAKGLPGIGDGTRKVAIFVDGVQIANHGAFYNEERLIGEPDIHVFGLLNHHGITDGRVAFDNLKIWNYAKTDFSDRFDDEEDDPGTPTPADELLLWNRLGSADQIANSEVGPSGTYTAGTFVPGPFGDALELNMQQQFGCTFPGTLLNSKKGCLEFWAKLSDFPVQMPFSKCMPGLIGSGTLSNPEHYGFFFSSNDGNANGGLCVRSDYGFVGTGPYGSWTYSQAIGGGDVAEWHHYAMVWDVDGIPCDATGNRKIGIFLDGQLISTSGFFRDDLPCFANMPDSYVFGLLNHQGLSQGRVAFDNLKIWNYAKTDFSDRFTEGEVVTYDVTVFKGSIDGTTSNSFPVTTLLNVRADTPPTGWHFASWTVDPDDADLGSTFDALQAETSLIMPPHAITLTAVWAPDATSLNNGLQLYYPFTSAAEGSEDASGNGHDGVLHGTTWQDDGRPSGSRRFGSGSYIDVGTEVNFAAWEQYSISLWFKRDLTPIDATGYGDKLLCKTDWYSDQHLRMLPGGSLHFSVTTGGGPHPSTGYVINCWENFQDNMWHHLVVVRSNDLATLWIDGTQKGVTSSAISITSNTKPLYLGYSPSGDAYQRRYWPGNVDELRIYDRALAPHEIDELLHGETRRLTVAFDVNGGEQAPTNTVVIMGAPYGELPQPSRTGYTFGGWLASTGGVAFIIAADTLVTLAEDHTLTAVWTPNTYTVTFDANGGEQAPTNTVVIMGAPYGELPQPTRTGYTFGGWLASTGGVAFVIAADTLVTLAEDHTLTAAWTPNTYTVTFDADGGEVAPISKTVTFNAAYGTLPTPAAPPASRLAWLFGGWVAAGDQPVTDATLVATASDHTLCAVWIEPAPLPDPEESPTFIGEAPYYGYLYRASDVGGQAASSVEGTIEFNVSTATGKLSAKAVTRGGPLNFRAAAWDADEAGGAYLVTLTRPGGETLALSVRGNRAWGTLSGGSLDGELLVECAHNRFRDHADAEAQSVLTDFKGLYTAALPPCVPSARRNAGGGKPQGAGYLSVSLGTYGRAKFAGVLADGTSVSMAAQALLIDGCGGWVCVPFFSPLYGRKGWIGGLVWLDPETGAAVVDRELGWMIRWDCTRGDAQDFSLLLDLCGGRYVKPPVLAPAYRFSANVTQVPLLYPGGTALFVEEALPIGLPVTVVGARMTMVYGRQPKMTDGAYDYSGENCALAKLSFSASTGIYKGTFSLYYDYISGNRPRHKKVTVQYAGILCPVRGAVFADAPAGMGHCLVPDNSTGPTLKRSFLNMLHEGAVPTL